MIKTELQTLADKVKRELDFLESSGFLNPLNGIGGPTAHTLAKDLSSAATELHTRCTTFGQSISREAAEDKEQFDTALNTVRQCTERLRKASERLKLYLPPNKSGEEDDDDITALAKSLKDYAGRLKIRFQGKRRWRPPAPEVQGERSSKKFKRTLGKSKQTSTQGRGVDDEAGAREASSQDTSV